MVRRLYVPAKKGLLDEYDEDPLVRRVQGVASSENIYQELLNLYQAIISPDSTKESYSCIDQVLDAAEINIFLEFALSKKIDRRELGFLVTKLMENAYTQGERKFQLNTGIKVTCT